MMRDSSWVPSGVDVTKANAARVYDYLLGGRHNFPADRWAGEQAVDEMPDVRSLVAARRQFQQRAVRFLLSAGIRQFIDLGSGLPTAGHVHEVVQGVDPQARVVYVEADPVAAAHGAALLEGIAGAAMIHADLRDARAVLAAARLRTIDSNQPVALLMVAVLNLLSDVDDPARVVDRYYDALPSGSYLVLSHPVRPDLVQPPREAGAAAVSLAGIGQRSQDEIAALLTDWKPVEPGLAQIELWRPEANVPLAPVAEVGGVARKA